MAGSGPPAASLRGGTRRAGVRVGQARDSLPGPWDRRCRPGLFHRYLAEGGWGRGRCDVYLYIKQRMECDISHPCTPGVVCALCMADGHPWRRFPNTTCSPLWRRTGQISIAARHDYVAHSALQGTLTPPLQPALALAPGQGQEQGQGCSAQRPPAPRRSAGAEAPRSAPPRAPPIRAWPRPGTRAAP